MTELVSTIADKLGHEAEAIGGVPAFENGKLQHAGFALSYLDNEGDTVSITTDHDLLEAIMLAKEARKDKVDLFVHDPEKPAMPTTLDPQPAIIPPTPTESSVRRRKQQESSEDEEEELMNAVLPRGAAVLQSCYSVVSSRSAAFATATCKRNGN